MADPRMDLRDERLSSMSVVMSILSESRMARNPRLWLLPGIEMKWTEEEWRRGDSRSKLNSSAALSA
jgi:hypothetical protein